MRFWIASFLFCFCFSAFAQIGTDKCQAQYFYKMMIAGQKEKGIKAEDAFKLNHHHFSLLNDGEQIHILNRIYTGEWRHLNAHEIIRIADQDRKNCLLEKE